MYSLERQQSMAQLIRQQGRVSVPELADRFAVTLETVRRDLTALDRMGLVRRVWGGAEPVGAWPEEEQLLDEREATHTAEKDAMAAAAYALLPPPGSTVLIDAGSTAARFALALPRDHRLTVVTHSVPVAVRLGGHAHIDVILLPGQVRTQSQAAVGPSTVAALAELRVAVAFVAADGVDPTHGLTTRDADEALVKQAIIGAGLRRILLADASKVGAAAAHRFATLDDLDVLVTDASIARADKRAIEEAGVEVVTAGS